MTTANIRKRVTLIEGTGSWVVNGERQAFAVFSGGICAIDFCGKKFMRTRWRGESFGNFERRVLKEFRNYATIIRAMQWEQYNEIAERILREI